MRMTVRHGIITDGSITPRGEGNTEESSLEAGNEIVGRKLHEIDSWQDVVRPSMRKVNANDTTYLANWLEQMLPRPNRQR